MALLSTTEARTLLERAAREHFAILAVNADSHAAVTDCLEAARECDAPIIIETSLWQLTGRSFGNGNPILGLARYLADLNALANSERFLTVPVIFHTDHIKGPDTIRILSAAISSGASTISLDSSEMTEEENIAHICQLCDIAQEAGLPLTIEMEAGVDAGVTEIAIADRLLCAVESRHPGCLALWAPGVGTQHGLSDKGYPFSPEAVAAHQKRASEICGRPIGLALHGSSGLQESDLRAGVAAGVAKVNWSSESLLIRSRAAQEYYTTHSAELEKSHPKWKATAMDHGVQSFVSERYVPKVVERIRILGGAGMGKWSGQIPPARSF
jgi:fructose-bisphosphate aldolase class II